MVTKSTKRQTSDHKQKSGSKQPLVLALLALFLGVGALTYFYAKNNTTLFGSNTQTNQTTQTTAQPNTTQPNGTTTPIADRKFNIPELGITLTLPDGLEGLEYGRVITYARTPGDYVGLTTKSLREAKDAQNHCTADNFALGYIGKFSTDPTQLGVNAFKENTFKIGDYYYTYLGPTSTCAESNETAQLQIKQTELLQSAFRKAGLIE